jgi:hypothetical protein
MTPMDPQQAYLAVVAFLNAHWEQHPVPGDYGDFCDMCDYVSGKGTRDPAMWTDWLAWVKKIQTGVLVPERRSWLKTEKMEPLDPEQAYLAMFEFIKEYWERVSRPAEIGDLLGRMKYAPGVGTADPKMWKRWLTAIEKVQSGR